MALLPDKGTEITETTTIAIQPNKTYKMLIEDEKVFILNCTAKTPLDVKIDKEDFKVMIYKKNCP